MITHAQLQQGLDANPKWVERAMVVLYERQTSDERATSTTRLKNGRGFASCDARSGTYMARWVMKGNRLNGEWLVRARKMAKKYSRQLLEAAEEKERLDKGYKSDIVVAMAEKLGIPLEKLTILDCKPGDVCGIPTQVK